MLAEMHANSGAPQSDSPIGEPLFSAQDNERERARVIIAHMQAGDLLKQALTLSDKERAELASSLIDRLDPTIDLDAEVAWQGEIARRLEEAEHGRVKTIPWEEVRRKGRALLDGE